MKIFGKIIWILSSSLVYFLYKNNAYCGSIYPLAGYSSIIEVRTYTRNSCASASNKCSFKVSTEGAPVYQVPGGVCGLNRYFSHCGTKSIADPDCFNNATCFPCPDNGKTVQSGFALYEDIVRSTCCHHRPDGTCFDKACNSYLVTYAVVKHYDVATIEDCYLPVGTHADSTGTYDLTDNCYYK